MSRKLVILLFLGVFYQPLDSAIKKTCYDSVGCFKNGPPWKTYRRPVLPPQDPKITEPFLTYYSRQSRDGIPFDVYPEPNLSKVPIDRNKESFVITHGYTDNGRLKWIMRLKNLLLDKRDANVFIPDYSKGVDGKFTQAVGNIRVFGKVYANALNKTGIPSSRLHIIGHSLGAQLSSYICKEMSEAGQRVGWLTALDPAGPLFETYDKRVRLDSSHADFVDVHHTNAGVRGMVLPYGHVDFYYNGGTRQPRCEVHNEFNGVSSCYHHMAHEYYISSIENECLYGLPSSMKSQSKLISATILRGKLTETHLHSCYPHSCIPVGLRTKSFPQRGIFTVLTHEYPPYCSKLQPLLSY